MDQFHDLGFKTNWSLCRQAFLHSIRIVTSIQKVVKIFKPIFPAIMYNHIPVLLATYTTGTYTTKMPASLHGCNIFVSKVKAISREATTVTAKLLRQVPQLSYSGTGVVSIKCKRNNAQQCCSEAAIRPWHRRESATRCQRRALTKKSHQCNLTGLLICVARRWNRYSTVVQLERIALYPMKRLQCIR